MTTVEYIVAKDFRLVRCNCCGVSVPASETVTDDGKTFCKDSAACIWRKKGENINVDVVFEDINKPLFGD